MSPPVTTEAHVCTVTAGTGELGTGAGAQTEDGLVGGAETAGLGRTRSVICSSVTPAGTRAIPWSRCRLSTGEVPAVELTRPSRHRPETGGVWCSEPPTTPGGDQT